METKIPIIFEDEELLVLNKPAGVVVNRADSVKGESLQDWLDEKLNLKQLAINEDNRLLLSRSGLAHRLDKDTSGCLVIGKTIQSLVSLLGQFKQRTIEKEYLALVHGRLEPRSGTVRLPIARDLQSRQRWRVHYSGKDAETTWEVVAYYRHKDEQLTLVRLQPKTGRTHQIRVHMSHLGHSLFADQRYLSSKRYASDSQILERHFLHAAKISLNHPGTGEKKTFEAPIPEDLAQTLKALTAEN